MKKVQTAAAGLAVVFALSACGGAATQSYKDKGELTVAMDALPPTTFLAEDNTTPIGLNPDIARLVAKKLGLKLKFENTAFDTIIPGSDGGRYDFTVTTMGATERRTNMSRISRKFAALILAIGTFLLFGAPPASAAPATIYNFSYCQDQGDYTFCAYERFESTRTDTPNGRVIIQLQGRAVYTSTWTDGTTESMTVSLHTQFVFEPGEILEENSHLRENVTFRSGETCLYAAHYVVTGSEIRVQSQTVTCG
jgi:hypothetical protein